MLLLMASTQPGWRTGPDGRVVWAAPRRRRLGRFHEWLGWAVLGLLGAVAIIDLADLGITLVRVALSQSDRPDPFRTYDLLERTRQLEAWHIKVCVVVAFGWIIWQTMAAVSSRVPRQALCYAPFFHATSWFIPIASLVMPLQNMADLRYATEYPLSRSEGILPPRRRITRLLAGWWLSWLVALPTLLFSISALPYALLEITPEVGATLEAAMDVVQIVNDVLAMAVVGEVHFRLRIQRQLRMEPIAPF